VPEPQGFPPEFVIEIQPCKVKEGQKAEFTCQVKGQPVPELTWLFNGQEIESQGQYAFMQRDQLQVLEVHEAVPTNSGTFEVVAKNPFGTVSCSADLQVQGQLFI
jgi:hypothetical protein